MVELGLKNLRQLAHVVCRDAVSCTGVCAGNAEEAVARLTALRVESMLRREDRCRASVTQDELLRVMAGAADDVFMGL